MWQNQSLNTINETAESLKQNEFKAIYVENRIEAVKAIFEEIPSKPTIGAGDSLTLRELSVLEELREKAFTVFWPFDKKVAKDKRRRVMRNALLSEVFISGSNSLT